ncbi:hypothetical protein RCRUDOLPH_77 [Rhodobacter phage RcRudolph]|nr:hypothetical protein RCRUDOLPH_77 [Rhodobacter phage RcRudolph]
MGMLDEERQQEAESLRRPAPRRDPAPRPEDFTDLPNPLTAGMLAEALECFWNAALGAQQQGMTPVSCMAEGINAVAIRLRELEAGS